MFYAFDVCADRAYVDFNIAVQLLKQSGFPCISEPLHCGSFAECLAYAEGAVDTAATSIPQALGLPTLAPESCIIEGFVVRPTRREAGKKWTIKIKIWRFLECAPNELQAALRDCGASVRPEPLKRLYLSLCKEPRLQAVLSKQPQLQEDPCTNLATIQHLFWEDVVKDVSGFRSAAQI